MTVIDSHDRQTSVTRTEDGDYVLMIRHNQRETVIAHKLQRNNGAVSIARALMPKVWIVAAEHPTQMSQPTSAHGTRASADVKAADLCNEIFTYINEAEHLLDGRSPIAKTTPAAWEADMIAAQAHMGVDIDEPDRFGVFDVWITELEIGQ
jgi:hypothetical protein